MATRPDIPAPQPDIDQPAAPPETPAQPMPVELPAGHPAEVVPDDGGVEMPPEQPREI